MDSPESCLPSGSGLRAAVNPLGPPNCPSPHQVPRLSSGGQVGADCACNLEHTDTLYIPSDRFMLLLRALTSARKQSSYLLLFALLFLFFFLFFFRKSHSEVFYWLLKEIIATAIRVLCVRQHQQATASPLGGEGHLDVRMPLSRICQRAATNHLGGQQGQTSAPLPASAFRGGWQPDGGFLSKDNREGGIKRWQRA